MEGVILHRLLRRAFSRIRRQRAVSWGTFGLLPALLIVCILTLAWRMDTLQTNAFWGLSVGLVVVGVLTGIAVALLRPISPLKTLQTIDRKNGLEDRLSTAWAFTEQGQVSHSEVTSALEGKAVTDGLAVVARANLVHSFPWQVPKSTKPAGGLLLCLLLCSLIPLGGGEKMAWNEVLTNPELPPATEVKNPPMDSDELVFSEEILKELEQLAKDTEDVSLKQFTEELRSALEKARKGEISKEALLATLAKAEKNYLNGPSADDLSEALKEMQKTGQTLSKSALTKDLGNALQKSDMTAAQKALQELKQKLEDEKLSEKEKNELSSTLEKAADEFEKRQAEKEKKLDEQIEKNEKASRLLKDKIAQAKDEPERKRLQKEEEEKKRELKKLQRDREKQEEESARQLKRLHRSMKQAAQDLKNEGKPQQDPKSGQKQAARSMEDMSRDTGKVDKDRRKIANQGKTESQRKDLGEAMKRARKSGGRGPEDRFGRNKKNQDFQKRAQGKSGSKKVWKPGEAETEQGENKNGDGNQQGQGSDSPYGDEHDENLLGDATKRLNTAKDESLTGEHGRGPSTKETISSAAQKGFASKAYKDVYGRYRAIVEEVINSEKIPAGYRYYVKRYFQKTNAQELSEPAPAAPPTSAPTPPPASPEPVSPPN